MFLFSFIISRLSNLRPDDSILSGSKFSILIKEYNKFKTTIKDKYIVNNPIIDNIVIIMVISIIMS